MPFGRDIFLFFAALLAGIINSVAGGGSFITFPALLFSGIAPIAANATNTCAVWPGTVASAVAYLRGKAYTPEARRILPALMIVGIIGGVLGARILLHTPQRTFTRLIPWLLLGATLVFVLSGRLSKWMRSRLRRDASGAAPSAEFRTPRPLLLAGLFVELLLSVYIGYFGAGVGILILALLALLGIENVHTMNAMKTLLVSVVNGVALLTFIVGHRIVWHAAVVMVAGSAVGGYAGAHFAQKTNPQRVRWAVIVIGFAMSAYFFVRYR